MLAFAVGAGSASPTSVLGASVPLTWSDILLRTLYYLGLLVGGGAAIFGLVMRRLLGDRMRRPLAHLLFFSLLFVFLGGSSILHGAPPGTRFDLVMKVAVTVALVGGAAAALAPSLPQLLPFAGACTLALMAAPTLSGHALDPGQPRVLSVLADLGHLVAAGAWFGGLAALVYVVPRATDGRRRTTGRRAPLLDGRAVGRDRDRRDRPCPRADRAVGRVPDLDDLLRPSADREDGDLRAAARRRLAEPEPDARRVRAPAPLRAPRARRDRSGSSSRWRSSPSCGPAKDVSRAASAAPTVSAARGAPARRRGRRRARARLARRRGRARARRARR